MNSINIQNNYNYEPVEPRRHTSANTVAGLTVLLFVGIGFTVGSVADDSAGNHNHKFTILTSLGFFIGGVVLGAFIKCVSTDE